MPVGTCPAGALRLVAPLIVAAAFFVSNQAFADDPEELRLRFGEDAYAIGDTLAGVGAPDGAVFAAGERVRLDGPTGRSAHLVGRLVTVGAPVGGSVYAAGYDVSLEAPVTDDATLAGYDLRVSAPVGGTVRAAGYEVTLEAPAGAFLARAERVVLDAEIAGDARIMAEEVEFGPDARIAGTLTVPEDVVLLPPDRAVPAERLEKVPGDPWERPGAFALIFGALLGLIGTAGTVLVVQALFLGAAPRWTEALAFDVAERPFRSLGIGFLALSVLVGSIPVLGASLVGAPLMVLPIIATPLAGLAGIALGAWALGVAIWRLMNRPGPEGFWMRLGIAAIGLVALGLVGLIPFAGWALTVAVALVGLGAAAMRLLGMAPRAA